MSAVSRDEVVRLAGLAKLDLTPEEIDLYGRELVAIVNFVDQLQQVDVSSHEPTEQVTGLKNIVREDKPDGRLLLTPEDLRQNAELKEGQFKTPKVNL